MGPGQGEATDQSSELSQRAHALTLLHPARAPVSPQAKQAGRQAGTACIACTHPPEEDHACPGPPQRLVGGGGHDVGILKGLQRASWVWHMSAGGRQAATARLKTQRSAAQRSAAQSCIAAHLRCLLSCHQAADVSHIHHEQRANLVCIRGSTQVQQKVGKALRIGGRAVRQGLALGRPCRTGPPPTRAPCIHQTQRRHVHGLSKSRRWAPTPSKPAHPPAMARRRA